MKFLISALIALTSTTAFAYSQEAIDNAQELVNLIEDRFAVGEVTKTDVNQARAYLQEMKFEAGQIDGKTYCTAILKNLEAVVIAVTEEEKVGMRTFEDVLNARKALYKTKAFCAKF